MEDSWKAQAFNFGHEVYLAQDEYTITDSGSRFYATWRYADNQLSYEEDNAIRKCPKCNELPKDWHDPCIANLPGVRAACCGHGVEEAYILFTDGTDIRGTDNVNRVVEELRTFEDTQ